MIWLYVIWAVAYYYRRNTFCVVSLNLLDAALSESGFGLIMLPPQDDFFIVCRKYSSILFCLIVQKNNYSELSGKRVLCTSITGVIQIMLLI